MKEIKLPSGATLKISHVDFEDAWDLYQAICEEMKSTQFSSEVEMSTLVKDIVLTSFSSQKICGKVIKCFKRCTYDNGKGDLKIDNQTFESEEARQDYVMVLVEVCEYAIVPFIKHLYAVYSRTLLAITKSPK